MINNFDRGKISLRFNLFNWNALVKSEGGGKRSKKTLAILLQYLTFLANTVKHIIKYREKQLSKVECSIIEFTTNPHKIVEESFTESMT